MNLNSLKSLHILFVLLVIPFISHASGYWLELKGSGKVNEPLRIQVCYGNIDEQSIRHRDKGAELALVGEFKITVIDAKGVRSNITIEPKADCWEGTFTPKQTGVYQILGINTDHPVVDRSKTGGKNVLPIDYLCTAYHVGDLTAVTKPAQFLDITAKSRGKLVVLKVFNSGRISGTETKLRVFNPDNWEKELSVNENGEATFMPTIKGLYVIRQDWEDPTPGTYKGVSYTSIRHRCNYCLQVQ